MSNDNFVDMLLASDVLDRISSDCVYTWIWSAVYRELGGHPVKLGPFGKNIFSLEARKG